MKTEMKIKTAKHLQKDEETHKTERGNVLDNANRLSVFFRGGACMALLLLLAVGGYTGASAPQAHMTAAPVETRTILTAGDVQMTYEEIRAEHERERQQEIDLLNSVIESDASSEETKQSALAQKTQIASRMEMEAQVRAALLHMGYAPAAAVCGAQQMTVILPQDSVKTDEDSVRVIDAAAAAAGIDAGSVKIILVKK